MKLLKAILVLTGISILSSCTSNVSYPDAMGNAIRCMEECPDSAQIYLSTLDSSIQHEQEETQMYYGLLTTKAADKKYICHKSDSLMKKVVHFYESYGDKEKLMEAYYYLGSVYRDMKDAPRAVAAFQQAMKIGENSHRYDLLGQIYEQMGTLLAYQSLYEDALRTYKISYDYYHKQKDELGLVYALRDQGRMYESLDQLDSAEYYYQAAYEKTFEIKDQRTINSISTELGNVYLDLGKLDSAKNVFSKIPELKNEATYLQGIGHIYLLTSQPDSAELYFIKALQEGKREQNIYLINSMYKRLAQIKAQKGNYHLAYNYALNSLNMGDTIEKETRTDAIGKINALYNYQHTEKENQQLLLENDQKQNLVYLLIIGLLIFVGAAILYTNHTRKQKRLAQEQARRLSILKDEQYKSSRTYIWENKKKIAALETQLQQTEGEKDVLQKELIQSKKALLEISNQKIEMSLNEKDCLEATLKQSDIYQLFHEVVRRDDKFRSFTEESWRQLQQIIDETYNDFTTRLCTLYPQISEHELRICYLIKIHIRTKDIAKILSRSLSAISNSRVRLYKKIHGEDGTPDMLDSFIIDL